MINSKKIVSRIIYTILVFNFSIGVLEAQIQRGYNYLYEDLPFDMPILQTPLFPDNEVNITDFGGIPDGIFLNIEAFKKAFAALELKGGGKLVVPSGVWFTGPITFRSNVNLHLEKGALILFSPDFDLYPLVSTVYEGLDTHRCQSPISGFQLQNIAITGEGTINGSGEAWRPLKKGRVSETYWKKVVGSGGVLKGTDFWFPSKKSLLGENMNANTPSKNFTDSDWLSFKDYLRPVMVSFIECKNVFLQGVLFENSPAWNIHPLMCENVIIDNIIVRNPYYAQNGDGIDLESCVNSIITNSVFDVGDDAICVKSGKNEDGRRRARPTINLIVDNCKVFQGHGGFVIGSEMSAGVSNVKVSNCQFLGTDVGLRFKAGRGRGGVVENIHIDNINMFNIATEPLLFDLYYGGNLAPSASIPLVDETTPIFKDIYVKNLTARNAKRAMFFNGLPEKNINNIRLENVIITSTLGAEILETDGVSFKNVKIYPTKGSAFILTNVKNMQVDDFEYPKNMKEIVKVCGSKNKNILFPLSLNRYNVSK